MEVNMHKTQLNLITAFVFWGVCSLACTACSQNNTIELSSYINQPISEITQVDNNFYKTDALYGTSYSNGAVSVYTNEDDDLTSSIIISAECNYSLYGVTFGMEIDKANQIANIACVSQTEDESKSKTYSMENGCYLYVQSQNGEIVTNVKLTNFDSNPNNGKGDLSYNDSNTNYTEETTYEYFNPDEFYIDYDLNNIGFYDMMSYTDWCKLSYIRYRNGEGYVEINPNKGGKYTFRNGYCMIYNFKPDTMNYSDAYSRIYRCDVVDNDNAILVPQDSGNYIKKNMQILERSVFHSNDYVYMTIHDGNSKGPYIPYEFIDWDSGEKSKNDSGDTVYKFNILK